MINTETKLQGLTFILFSIIKLCNVSAIIDILIIKQYILTKMYKFIFYEI